MASEAEQEAKPKPNVPSALIASFKLSSLPDTAVPDIVPVLAGEYELSGSNHGKPVYRKKQLSNGNAGSNHDDVFLYYWDSIDEIDAEDPGSWWFGSRVGEDAVWAVNQSITALPPEDGWCFHDDSIDNLKLHIEFIWAHSKDHESTSNSQPPSESKQGTQPQDASQVQLSVGSWKCRPKAAMRRKAPEQDQSDRDELPMQHTLPDRESSSSRSLSERRCCNVSPPRVEPPSQCPSAQPAASPPRSRSRSIVRRAPPLKSSNSCSGGRPRRPDQRSHHDGTDRRREVLKRGLRSQSCLDLSRMRLDDDALRRWCSSKGRQQVEQYGVGIYDLVDASNNSLTDKGVGYLVDFILEHRLCARRVRLCGNQLREPNTICDLIEHRDAGAGARDGLVELHMTRNSISVVAMSRVLDSLRRRAAACRSLRPPFWICVDHNESLTDFSSDLIRTHKEKGLQVCLCRSFRRSGCNPNECRHGADVHLHIDWKNRDPTPRRRRQICASWPSRSRSRQRSACQRSGSSRVRPQPALGNGDSHAATPGSI